jgi:hypothetical protein
MNHSIQRHALPRHLLRKLGTTQTCVRLSATHASQLPTDSLEHFVTPTLQNTNNCDVTVYFPFNLFTREGTALRVGLATIRTCHVY